jgi:hypothetical protein
VPHQLKRSPAHEERSGSASWIGAALALAAAIHILVFVMVLNSPPDSTFLAAGLRAIPFVWVAVLFVVGGYVVQETARSVSGLQDTRIGKSYLTIALVVTIAALAGTTFGFIAQDQLRGLFVPCRDLFGGDPPSCDPWRVIDTWLPWAGLLLGGVLGWLTTISLLRRRRRNAEPATVTRYS